MSLERYRIQIDKIDDDIINNLEKRLIISKMIGKLKKKNNVEINHSDRESEIIDRLCKKKTKLKNVDIEKFYKLLFNISKSVQT